MKQKDDIQFSLPGNVPKVRPLLPPLFPSRRCFLGLKLLKTLHWPSTKQSKRFQTDRSTCLLDYGELLSKSGAWRARWRRVAREQVEANLEERSSQTELKVTLQHPNLTWLAMAITHGQSQLTGIGHHFSHKESPDNYIFKPQPKGGVGLTKN